MDDSKTLLVQGAPQTVKFALGENVTRKGGGGSGPTRFPASREGVEATYVAAFEAARAYRQAWDDYEANPSAYPAPPRRDLRLEALVDIMEGEIRVHAHSYRSDEIVMLIRVAERFGFKIDVFTHVLEGFKVADEMAAHGAGGSTFSDWWQYKLEAYDAIPYNATVMQEHGVVTSLNSDIPWLQTFLREEMAKPVKYGAVSPEEAMRMLTLYPAMQLLIEDRVGSLEVGKDGDVLLLSGHPFNTYSRVEQTIVDGIVYYDRTREVEMRGEPVRSMPDFAPSVSGDFGLGAPESLDQEALPESAREDAPPLVTDRVYALVGATIHPVSGPAIENGVVVVQEGRISAVGSAASVEIPPDARRVDVSGKHVYPGMIDPITQMGMAEIGQVAASRDDRETGKYNPHIRGLTGVHPHSEAIPVARANGVLASLAVPGSGVIQGAGSLIQLDGDTPERMEIEDRAAIVVNLPSPSGKSWDDPKLEGDELESLLDLFARARLYANRPSVRERADEPFDPNIRFGQAHLLEALVPAVTGTMPDGPARPGQLSGDEAGDRGRRSGFPRRRRAGGARHPGDRGVRAYPNDGSRRPALGRLAERGHPRRGRGQDRVRDERRRRGAESTVPRSALGRLRAPAGRGDEGAHPECGGDPRGVRSDGKHRGREAGGPDRDRRGSHADHHPRGSGVHQRRRSTAHQQANRVVQEIPQPPRERGDYHAARRLRASGIRGERPGRRVWRGWPMTAIGFRRAGVLLALGAVCFAGIATASAQEEGLKVYISADMEGVVGAVTGEQLGPDGFEYQRFREFMTEEVLAAIEAAREAGATEILVSDSHGNGQNLLIDRFPADVQVVRSWPRPLMMMQGIDSTFDAAILIGYHAGTTNPEGVRAHTMSSARLTDIRLNGQSIPEAGMSAAIAGHFGVPVVMISGDDAAVEEAQHVIGDIEGAIVKWSYGFHSARTLTPAAGYALIREKVKTALGRIGDFAAVRLQSPVTLEVSFKSYRPVQVLAYLPIVELVDAHTIRYLAEDALAASAFLEFLLSYNSELQP
jgi:D-aminopeptidase/imidazolonepropionase-like amidohydrolase